ncbi:MAG TPA: hypothetical protein ENJ23_04360 [Bacteroidetes bacterium]|nr:hypothetical protein [Bacteroidota bacterium]
MAQKKRKKKKPAVAVQKTEPNKFLDFFAEHPNFLPLTIIFVLLLILFNQVIFGGKTLLPPDTLTARSYRPFIEQALKNGMYPLWNPYIFSGMPSFASLASAPFVDLLGDVINGVIWLFKLVFPLPDFTRILLNYFLFGVFTYILLMRKTGLRLAALFAAITFLFQPGVVAFPAFGHNTKLLTAMMIPVIFLLVEEVLEERKLLHASLLALAVGLQLLRAHVQMSYYTFMMVGLFVLYWMVDTYVREKKIGDILKSLGLLAAALVVGVLMSSWLYLSVREYSHFSIRGGAKGLDYGYATSWSFSPLEVLTFFVPSFVGFGGQTYWGNMPFTDFPFYMGIIPLFLAGLAFVVQKERTVYFMGLLGLLALLVSFGKEFSLFYDILFKLLPYFSKFRVPSMILILVQFAVVVLSALALYGLWRYRETEIPAPLLRKIRYFVYGFSGVSLLIFLYVLLGKGSMMSRMAASGKVVNPALQAQSYRMALSDAWIMVLFLAVTVTLLWLFLAKKIRFGSLAITLIAFTLLDLWRIDFKIIQPRPKASEAAFFRADDTVKFLKSDTTLYRILPVFDDRPDNWYMYHFIQNVNGYHAAKLKIYQEMLEETGFPRNFLLKYYKPVMQNGSQAMAPRAPSEMDLGLWRLHENVLRMLNAKYIVTPYAFQDSSYQVVRTGQKNIFLHKTVLPRAFFVDQVERVIDRQGVFARLRSADFDPARTALVYEELPVPVQGSPENRVKVSHWDIHHIRLQVHAAAPAFLVLSEVYYPAGWEAKIDGRPAKIYQTNHILRGMVVPPGDHEISLAFRPASFRIGLIITAITFLGSLLLFGLAYSRERKSKAEKASS